MPSASLLYLGAGRRTAVACCSVAAQQRFINLVDVLYDNDRRFPECRKALPDLVEGSDLPATCSVPPVGWRSCASFAVEGTPAPTANGAQWLSAARRGSVLRRRPLSISIAVRSGPYNAIWCMRYSDT